MITANFGSTSSITQAQQRKTLRDPAFDGDPTHIVIEEIELDGTTRVVSDEPSLEERTETDRHEVSLIVEPPEEEHRKLYFDGGVVDVVTHLVYELDPDGSQLQVVR